MSDPIEPSRVERHLDGLGIIVPGAEMELDILRQVLRKELGTDAQRSTLMRIIKEHKPKPRYGQLMATKLHMGDLTKHYQANPFTSYTG